MFWLYCYLRGLSARFTWRILCWVRRRKLSAQTRVFGTEHLDATIDWQGPIIAVIGGHATFPDSVVIGAEIPTTSPLYGGRFLTKVQVYALRKPWPWFRLGWVLPLLGCIKVESRDDSPAGSLKALRRVQRHVRSEPILLFAEGGWSPERGLRPFGRGISAFVAAAGRPTLIVPMALTVDRFNPHPEVRWPLAGATYRLAVGQPFPVIPPADRSASLQLVKQVEQSVQALHKSIQPDRLDAIREQFA